jgi:hypothetical protein
MLLWTCWRDKTRALPLEQQRNSSPAARETRSVPLRCVARNEPHVTLCHLPDRRRFLSALSGLYQVQKSTEQVA